MALVAKRTALVALLATPGTRDPWTTARTPRLAVVISDASAMPYPASFSRQLRKAIFELWRADLTYLGGEGGILWGDVPVKADLHATLSPVQWKNCFFPLEGMPIFTPGDLRSILLSALHLVTDPGVRSEMPRELWNAARAHRQHSD